MNAVAIRWLHRNLFSKPFDIALSLVVIPLLAWVFAAFAHWAVLEARWDILVDSLKVLMVGIFPDRELWRAWVAVAIMSALFGIGLGLSVTPTHRSLAAIVVAVVALAAVVARAPGPEAGVLALTVAATGLAGWQLSNRLPVVRRFVAPGFLLGIVAIFVVLAPPGLGVWGGLLLSAVLTIVASVLALPLGILLAFGRQSRIPSLRLLCAGYIEIMRSVPLILVVYWVWILVPLLEPETTVPSALRGMAGYVVFFAAYVAEYVRSGLQAVPKGQVEAAQSLGMNGWTLNTDIVLPQAIRVVVPALVGQILDIFNGATLVFIIGLTDFLRAGQMILANPQNSGRLYEVYVFLFAVYFVIGAAITYASRRLETHLGKGSR